VSDPSKPFFLQALDALKGGDRRGAAALIGRELREGNTSAKNLPSVSSLAAHIGEIELAIDASRRAVLPGSFDSLLAYWATLATYGRSDEALIDIERQPVAIKDHPAVLHFRGTAATQFGRFDEAQELFRRTLAKAPSAMQTWFALAMIKNFSAGDPDFAAMERLERQPAGAPPEMRASLEYALGKAAEDLGDIDRAFEFYSAGAALRRQQGAFSIEGFRQVADKVIRDFTPDSLKTLRPSGFDNERSLFVTGLPRSGTTLTEQILLGHSKVVNGAELNLFGPALMPTLGVGLGEALTYEQRSNQPDPWGEIGRDYGRLIDVQFRSPGLVVDKSLSQETLIGLMLHALPQARIAWLRRSPDDVALSCFKTYFTTGLPWTSSLTDIADYMRIEDRLFDHWRAVFPERILVVPYEELAASPEDWALRLQQHFGLPIEAGLENSPRDDRSVQTASVGQVREPISTSRIGQAAAFERQLKPFRDRYYA
jgi:tetratricopeptide (TPR) repeat protein